MAPLKFIPYMRRWRHFLSASLLHIVLLLLLMGWSLYVVVMPSPSRSVSQVDAKPVQALVVDQAAVQAQLKQLHDAKRQSQQVNQKKQQEAINTRKKEAQQLASLKRQQQALAKQVAAAKAEQAKTDTALRQSQQALRVAKAKQAALTAAAKAQEEAAAKREQQQVAQAAQEALTASQMARYKTMITQKISRYWLLPSNVKPEVSCQLLIKLGPGGLVLDAKVVRGSGNPVLDRSARTAVLKASPLPVPEDPAQFDKFRTLRLTVRPEQLL